MFNLCEKRNIFSLNKDQSIGYRLSWEYFDQSPYKAKIAQGAALAGNKFSLQYLHSLKDVTYDAQTALYAIMGHHYDLAQWIMDTMRLHREFDGYFVTNCLCYEDGPSSELQKFLLDENHFKLLNDFGLEYWMLMEQGKLQSVRWLWNHRHLYDCKVDLKRQARQLRCQEILDWLETLE